jgi:hypothetical protein
VAFNSVPQGWIAVGKALVQALFQRMKDNLDWLYAAIGGMASSEIPNGSFEIDSDGDGAPDGVTINLYAGGSSGLYTTAPGHASKSLYFTHPGGSGNGGGYGTLDYTPCSPYKPVPIAFITWATAAGMRNMVEMLWYDKDKVALSGGDASTTIYDSTTNPTGRTRFLRVVTPPSDARYFKVVVRGGVDTVDVAGTAYFDGIEIDPAARIVVPGTGISEVSTTNTFFTDVGSFTVDLGPVSSDSFAEFILRADLKNQGADTGSQRFRVGTHYSEPVDNVTGSYVGNTFRVLAGGVTGVVTVHMQLKSEGGYTCYGRKPDAGTVVIVHRP